MAGRADCVVLSRSSWVSNCSWVSNYKFRQTVAASTIPHGMTHSGACASSRASTQLYFHSVCGRMQHLQEAKLAAASFSTVVPAVLCISM